jgi:hypothetical protein
VRCESDDPVARQIERFDILLVGRLAEIERLGGIESSAFAIEINS